jgi:hypothetical protein
LKSNKFQNGLSGKNGIDASGSNSHSRQNGVQKGYFTTLGEGAPCATSQLLGQQGDTQKIPGGFGVTPFSPKSCMPRAGAAKTRLKIARIAEISKGKHQFPRLYYCIIIAVKKERYE